MLRPSTSAAGLWSRPSACSGWCIFSGGLWTVLLLRQVAAAFWITVLVPGVILMILVALFGGNPRGSVGMIARVLGTLQPGRIFLRPLAVFPRPGHAMDGGAIVMPEMRGLARLKSRAGRRQPRRTVAPAGRPCVKEIQFHQSQFVHGVAGFATPRRHRHRAKAGHISQEIPTTEFVLESFWGLWLVMPLLVGARRVAEERKIGTHEGQLCLPVKRRDQFATVKFCVALALSVLFGVAHAVAAGRDANSAGTHI